MSIISKLTKEEILMVEMLTYLDEDVTKAAKDGIFPTEVNFYKISENNKARTIGEILETFDVCALINLQSHSENICGADLNGKEWAEIIRYIQNSEALSNLTLVDMYMDTHDYHVATDSNGKTYPYPLGLCFTDGEEALVAFKGTTGPTEWKDNAYSATVIETDPQINAFNFVDRVSKTYSNITVTGHSKGANKAMYSTIRCENVKKCVCFDGEGFSDKFLNAYSSEIMKRASNITNISLSSDFVHILLTQIPGSKQLYVRGYDVDSMGENHSPNSFFKTTEDIDLFHSIMKEIEKEYGEDVDYNMAFQIACNRYGEDYINSLINGKMILQFTSLYDQTPVFEYEDEKEEVAKLHELAQYLVSHGRESEQIINYLGNLLPLLILEKNLDGSDATVSDIRLAILSDETALAKLLGRILCFINDNNIDTDFINSMLKAFNCDDIPTLTANSGHGILALFINQLVDIGIDNVTEGFYDPDSIVSGKVWDKVQDSLGKYISKSTFERIWGRMQREYLGFVSNSVKWHDDKEFIKEINDLYKFANSDFVKSLNVNWDKSSIKQIKNVNDLYHHIEDIANKNPDRWQSYRTLIEDLNNGINIIIQNSEYYDIRYIIYDEYLTKIKDMLAQKGYTLQLGNGEDNDITVSKDNVVVYGGTGEDIIYGNTSSENILLGGDDADVINGGSYDDVIYGGGGKDTINGGKGEDTLYGEGGNDVYIFDKDILGNSENRGVSNDHDIVIDALGENSVYFKNLLKTDCEKYIDFQKKGNDLVIKAKQTGASMTLKNYYSNGQNFNFKFAAKNGEMNKRSYYLDDKMQLKGSSSAYSYNSDNAFGPGIFGNGFNEYIRSIMWKSGQDLANAFVNAGKAQPSRDPLIIDLNGDGVHTTNVENGVYFDIDNNGFAEKTAWIDTTDGFLVYNRDEDPRITNGSELFSDQVIFSDGTRSKDGFDVLRTFNTYTDDEKDPDNDGWIDKNDAEFSKLRVWIDKDHDGIAWLPAEGQEDDPELKELYTLDELGITSISTKYRTVSSKDGNNKIEADVIMNGEKTTVSEHWFETSSFDTQELHTEGIDNDLTSIGSLHSVSYALEHDKDGYITHLVNSFRRSDDYIEKRVLSRKILYHISGADNIPNNSRGELIDARDLHVVETIMGVDKFVGADGSNNPNANAAEILRDMFEKFDDLYFNILNQDSSIANTIELISVNVDENGTVSLDMEEINSLISGMTDTHGAPDDLICSICSLLKAFDTA